MPGGSPLAPYDALLVVSFGGPEKPDDVIPFLENVTRGRDIPRERLVEVGEHYFAFGGRSPINDQCRAFLSAVRVDLAGHGLDIPVYWGNRNWHPFLADTVARMTRDRVRRAAVLVTSAYSSYSGCRQYREDLYDAVAATSGAPRFDKLRHYFNHPGFVDAVVDHTVTALESLAAEKPQRAVRLVFVTHSIPTVMAHGAGPSGDAYVTQHRNAAALVADGVRAATGVTAEWDLVYCSRSGSPRTPWLEPDVNDHLAALRESGTTSVVLVPIGFVSDHMEVIYDLDTEAAATAADLGMTLRRAATAGVHPSFVSMVRDLLAERAGVERGEQVRRQAPGIGSPSWDTCLSTCCPNPRGPRPALCEVPTANVAAS
jgi:ferrochelatase